jgi:hypothetical protein
MLEDIEQKARRDKGAGATLAIARIHRAHPARRWQLAD